MSATSGKTFYESPVDVNTSGPGTSITPLLIARAAALGGEAQTVFVNQIPGANEGDPPICTFSIVAVADRPSGNDPATSAPYAPVSGFYDQLGPAGYLTDTFDKLQALAGQKYGAAIVPFLNDQNVGSYGEG